MGLSMEKALVGAFSMIAQPVVEPMEHYTALALTSSQLCTTSSAGSPSSRMWRRHELKLAASGCTYFPPSASRCEWNTN